GLSLAGMMELPVFILLAQRPAPATGMPTRTAQEDLKFAISAGHGEFPRAIYAPGTLRQCYDLTRLAIETAHRFQSPAIMLTDQYLQDMEKNIDPLNEAYNPIDRHLCDCGNSGYKRYEITADGVSPRAVPGGEALVVCDSDEHADDGHLTEDFKVRIAMQNKRMAKNKGFLKEFVPPEYFGAPDAKKTFICWGSTCGPCREAVELLNREDGSAAAMLHFSQVWPLVPEICSNFLKNARRIIVVEGNYTGQFASVLKEQGIIRDCEHILRFDGLPFTAEYILMEVMK
ncbi:MAG: 2-oxoacid:acceptor oxidoreductase subunit alpha, partial [Victivallaceae bacterium]